MEINNKDATLMLLSINSILILKEQALNKIISFILRLVICTALLQSKSIALKQSHLEFKIVIVNLPVVVLTAKYSPGVIFDKLESFW